MDVYPIIGRLKITIMQIEILKILVNYTFQLLKVSIYFHTTTFNNNTKISMGEENN